MLAKILKIKLILMDVDGVLTDGSILYSENGDELKVFNVQDGLGIRMARMAGLKTGLITGRKSRLLQRRAEELQLDVVIQGALNKLPEYERVKEQLALSDEEIAYIGDDILDLPVLKCVGFSIAVANARDEVKALCDYVTVAGGGQGAVREAIDKILKRQDKFYDVLERLQNAAE